MGSLNKTEARLRRRKRVRKKIYGTIEKPRLAVFKSNKHLYAQVIDDIKGQTLCAASDVKAADNTKIESAKEIGLNIAKAAKKAGVKKVVFDRGGYIYHGIIKSLAEGAREGGLEF